MIHRTRYPRNEWKIGREVEFTPYNPRAKGWTAKIIDITPRCVILDNHSKWYRNEVLAKSWDGAFNGYIEVIVSPEEEQWERLISEICKIDWDETQCEFLAEVIASARCYGSLPTEETNNET